MTQQSTTATIQAALGKMAADDLTDASTQLLAALGYRSDRLLDGQTGNVSHFISDFKADNTDTRSERDFLDSTREVRILFQFTDTEIAATGQRMMFDAEGFSAGNSRSFIFAAVELDGDTYPRGRYVSFTREINKRFNRMPAAVVFRTADGKVTLAFVNRRPSKTRTDRQVLGSVSLVREIDAVNPHRAHLDILAEISLPDRLKWMDDHGKAHNFDGLLAGWLAALDTEELNRRFYQDLFRWFQKAVATAKFPDSATKTVTPEEHVIRLITRLMFVWFIKEKGLVAEELFIENRVGQALKGYDNVGGDSYYRAVLQNLFFATLNTEIGERRFSRENNDDHRNFSVYRYRNEMVEPDRLLEMFTQTPFINGGLFDYLDSFDGTRAGGVRIDCFTDNARHRAGYSIPNRLFFDEHRDAPGLITLFNRYKFTVEENTPADREVALDPELLGKVFENLLAAFNPETRENARKQTGSYYTPRTVVDYMVDEALVATLSRKDVPTDSDAESWETRLRHLFDYDVADTADLFTSVEREAIVRAIAGVKVLDPAVGSGAFPMGVLHKLTLALRRLDPHNELWEELQKDLASQRAASAFHTADQSERDDELREISATFERYRDSDFGRKLYLIQNGIYGVDIQPIATQIAKLRFFISLAIEQEPSSDAGDNYGIKPLPNLETRFVAADTLLGLARPAQMSLGQTDAVKELQRELDRNRESHFHANTRQQKQAYRREDSRLRQELAHALREANFSVGDADKIAAWDPYDQNTHADWFDSEYMFGTPEGFDVVIGNPPYVQLQKDGGRLGTLYKDAGYVTFARTGDIYQLFQERGCQLLKAGQGILTYITSNSWLKAEYGKKTRQYLSEQHTPFVLLELGKDVFDEAIVDASVLLLRQGVRNNRKQGAIRAVDIDHLDDSDFPPPAEQWGRARPNGDAPWSILSTTEQSVMDKMLAVGKPLKDWDIAINYGIKTGYNEAFIIDNRTKDELVAQDPRSAEIIKPVVRGRDIRRYRVAWAGLWLIDTHNGYGDTPAIDVSHYPAVKAHLEDHYEQLAKRYDKGRTPYNLRNCAYHADFAKEKLLWMDMSPEGRFAYSDQELFCNDKGFIMTGNALKYLCAVLNSSLVTWFMEVTALTTGMGVLQWKKFAVERLPVPKIATTQQRTLAHLVDRIVAQSAGRKTDSRELQAEIDCKIYELYGLTSAEIRAIEGE